MRIDIRHIRNFLAVAEALHFRRAAERINLAQPALSRSIRDLEQRIGVELFRRSRRSVELTPAGTVLLREWRGILDQIERGGQRARAAELGEIGTVRIAYTDFAIAGELPRLIQAYAQHAPEVEIETRHAVTWRQIVALEQGEIDVGFVTGPIEHPEFETLLVQQERCVLVAPKDHPLARRSEISLTDLAGEPFILGDDKDWRNFHAYIYSECHRAGFEPRVMQRAYNTVGIFGLVAAGMGITLHAESARNTLHPELVIRPVTDFHAMIPTIAAWSRDNQAPAVQAFTAFLLERCSMDAIDA